MNTILEQIRQELENSVDEKTQDTAQNFFKEEIKAYGIKVPVINKIGKEFFLKIKSNPKTEIFALCEKLWKSGYLEESFIACNWSYALHKHHPPIPILLKKLHLSKCNFFIFGFVLFPCQIN